MADIVTRLRKMNYHVNGVASSIGDEAANEIERLRGLVVELRPYLESDVRDGLGCRPEPIHTHTEDCIDCAWYAEAVAWKARLDAGELDVVPRD